MNNRMNISSLENIDKLIGCRFSTYRKTKSSDWTRVFVGDTAGTSIGRLFFKNGELTDIKCYKKHYQNTICETDYIFMRLVKYIQDGVVISKGRFNLLVNQAEKECKQDLSQKIAWRKTHIKKDVNGDVKRRKRLVGRNVRHILQELINDAV